MAAHSEIRDGDRMEICAQLPDKNEPRETPVFIIMGNDWNFRFVFLLKYRKYYASLERQNTVPSIECKPFTLNFDVGFKNGNQLSLGEGSIKIRSAKKYRFFEFEKFHLEYKLPTDFKEDIIIKFVLRFQFSKKPVMLFNFMPHSQDKAVQTSSYLNSEVPVETRSEDFSRLLDSDVEHDVEVLCEGRTVKAHKNVLAARSEVFRAMLQSDMLEGRSGIVRIEDMDGNYIQDFVRYLYTGIMPEMTPEKAMALYEAGDKYAVSSLMFRCSEYLQDNLNREIACECLALAEAHSDETLKNSVVTYILENNIFLKSDLWLTFCEVLADKRSDENFQKRTVTYILENKVYLWEDLWLSFCKACPKIGIEIYRLSYE